MKNRIEAGEKMPPVILAAVKLNAKTVIIEGHSRCVAYCVSDFEGDIEAIIGLSDDMEDWAYF
jgi:hypothetical protein